MYRSRKSLEEDGFIKQYRDVNLWLIETFWLQSLIHPNIVTLLDFDIKTKMIKLERGRSIRRGDSLVQLADGLEAALHYIHEVGVIHGDIKPDNIIFVDNKFKLIDFEHTTIIGRDVTTGTYYTEGYRHPNMDAIGHAAPYLDWWAAAVTLENLTNLFYKKPSNPDPMRIRRSGGFASAEDIYNRSIAHLYVKKKIKQWKAKRPIYERRKIPTYHEVQFPIMEYLPKEVAETMCIIIEDYHQPLNKPLFTVIILISAIINCQFIKNIKSFFRKFGINDKPKLLINKFLISLRLKVNSNIHGL